MLPSQTYVHLLGAQQSQPTDTRLWWSKAQCFLWGQARIMGSSGSKDSNSPKALKEVFKDNARERITGCVIIWCITLWFVDGNQVIFQESQSSTFWFQLVWGLRVGSQHVVDFLHLMGVLLSAKPFKDMAQDITVSPWRGTQGPWLYFFIFPVFLHFLTSPIKFPLWKFWRA